MSAAAEIEAAPAATHRSLGRQGVCWSTACTARATFSSDGGFANPPGTCEGGIISSAGEEEAMIPLRTGVRPRGVLILRGTRLSHQSLEALGGLVSISLDRSTAMEEVTRSDAAKENDRLRSLMLDSITHDLGDPLNFINTSVQTLIDERCGTQATQELLTAVHH